jgi:hypothetical protein
VIESSTAVLFEASVPDCALKTTSPEYPPVPGLCSSSRLRPVADCVPDRSTLLVKVWLTEAEAASSPASRTTQTARTRHGWPPHAMPSRCSHGRLLPCVRVPADGEALTDAGPSP